jgi:hypothetical protein
MSQKSSVVLILLLTSISLAGPKSDTKKLIEFGWDEPSTSFMRQHIEEMEKTPFDGVVFHAKWAKPDGSPGGDFMWDCWGKRSFTIQELQPALDDLKATRFTKLKYNFLRFNTTPSKDQWSKEDWFGDFSAILANAKLAGRFAKEGGQKGILFDIEQYTAPLFAYREQRESKTKSYEEYAAQVRKRGKEVMEAFQEGYGENLTVFLTFGYCLPWGESQGGKKQLADVGYGMLAPFCDGLVEGIHGNTILVDGHEYSYHYRDVAQYDKAYKAMSQDLLPIVKDPDKYKQVMSLGFGVWMDDNWRKHGWDVNDVSKNYFTPEVFESIVRKALDTSDEYVWIYTEKPRWWSDNGGPVELPPAYDAALRRAKQRDAK